MLPIKTMCLKEMGYLVNIDDLSREESNDYDYRVDVKLRATRHREEYGKIVEK